MHSQPFQFAHPPVGNRRTLLYCSVLCGNVETLVENTGGEHVGHTLQQGYHSVRGEGHGYMDIPETIVYRYLLRIIFV